MRKDFETKFSASSNKKEESMSHICKRQGKEAQKVRCLSVSYVLSTILCVFFFNGLGYLFCFCKFNYAFGLSYIRKKKRKLGHHESVYHTNTKFLEEGNGQKGLADLDLESCPAFPSQVFGVVCAFLCCLTQQGPWP